jgi:hypothetical protein
MGTAAPSDGNEYVQGSRSHAKVEDLNGSVREMA